MNAEQIRAILKDTFNTVSSVYDNPVLRFFPASARHLAHLLPLRGHERVLDVATGTGYAALEIASRLPSGHVMGVDFSVGMLEQARIKSAACGATHVDFAEMDMQDLRFPNASFSFFNLPEPMQTAAQRMLASFEDVAEGIQWPQGDHSIFVQHGCPSIAVSSKWLIDHMDTQDLTHTPKDNPSIVDPRKVAQIAEALDWLLRNLKP